MDVENLLGQKDYKREQRNGTDCEKYFTLYKFLGYVSPKGHNDNNFKQNNKYK